MKITVENPVEMWVGPSYSHVVWPLGWLSLTKNTRQQAVIHSALEFHKLKIGEFLDKSIEQLPMVNFTSFLQPGGQKLKHLGIEE